MTDEHPFEKLRREALADCDRPEEITKAGKFVRDALDLSPVVEISLAPGNGTRYPLLFARATGTATWTSDREHLESASAGLEDPSVVWVVTLGAKSRAYPIQLLGRNDAPQVSYVAEKWCDGNLGFDAAILRELLLVVAQG